jgi:hypothetical protein
MMIVFLFVFISIVLVVSAQPCGHSVNQCVQAGLSASSWCDCCDAVACNASVGVAIRLSWLDCLRRGWCAAGGGPCRHTPRCDDLDAAIDAHQLRLLQLSDAPALPDASLVPVTDAATDAISTTLDMGDVETSLGSVLFVLFVIVLACLAGIAITKIDLVSMGIS